MSDENLSSLLEAVATKQAEKAEADAKAKAISKELAQLEALAVEQLAASGLEGVRCAGKTWGTREFVSVTVPAEHKKAVVEAAERAGLREFMAVNTSTLKSWLLERPRDTAEFDEGIAAGTPSDGLVREYREVRLSHRTVG